MAFELPKLPYAYDALEPHIDARTMEIHHTKHHNAYTTNLNAAIQGTDLDGLTIENILINLDKKNAAVRNNGGGYYNHNLFWKVMSPNGGGLPKGDLLDAIEKDFGTFEEFKAKFSKAGATQFGSGWAWLVQDAQGALKIISTSNAGTPMTEGLTALLTCDVWEHAYYIDYRNARPDYINAFWSLVNWDFVAKNLK